MITSKVPGFAARIRQQLLEARRIAGWLAFFAALAFATRKAYQCAPVKGASPDAP